MNQLQDDYETNHQENIKWQEITDFSLKVHVLVNMLVPIVSTNTWWFGG